jgi:hypothetical protein
MEQPSCLFHFLAVSSGAVNLVWSLRQTVASAVPGTWERLSFDGRVLPLSFLGFLLLPPISFRNRWNNF